MDWLAENWRMLTEVSGVAVALLTVLLLTKWGQGNKGALVTVMKGLEVFRMGLDVVLVDLSDADQLVGDAVEDVGVDDHGGGADPVDEGFEEGDGPVEPQRGAQDGVQRRTDCQQRVGGGEGDGSGSR